jgi:hypothetical protein
MVKEIEKKKEGKKKTEEVEKKMKKSRDMGEREE